jgi:hypothetical protein
MQAVADPAGGSDVPLRELQALLTHPFDPDVWEPAQTLPPLTAGDNSKSNRGRDTPAHGSSFDGAADAVTVDANAVEGAADDVKGDANDGEGAADDVIVSTLLDTLPPPNFRNGLQTSCGGQ